MVSRGEFREDLYYRLDGYLIRLPPLRERGDDLMLLVEHFLCRLRKELDRPVEGISPEAVELLTAYSWPGNIRELEAVIRQALLRTTGAAILPEFLPDSVRWCLMPPDARGEGLVSDLKPFVDDSLRRRSPRIYADATELMERYVLTRVLRETHGNQSQAARLLGITRGCLRSRIRTLKISVETQVSQEVAPIANYAAYEHAAAGL
jgi:two-component system nitrogen regulation response regulator GlnG